MPANPDDPWGPIGGIALPWLTDAYHAVERVLHFVFGDDQPATMYVPGADQPQPGNTATLLAVVAIVLASAAFGIAFRIRRRVAGPLEPTGTVRRWPDAGRSQTENAPSDLLRCSV